MPRINQRGTDHDYPLRFQPILAGGHELDALNVGDDFRAVQHLTLTFLHQQIEDVLGVPGSGGVQFVAVEQFKSVKHRCRLLGAARPNDTAQRVLRRLSAICTSDEHCKRWVVRRLIGKIGGEAH